LNVILSTPIENSISVPRLPLFRLQASKSHDVDLTTAERNDLLPDFSQPVPPLKDFIDLAMSNRLELKIINKQTSVASAQLKSAFGNIIPTPEFMWGRDFSGNPPVPETGSDATVGLLFNVLVQLPVLDFQQGQIAQLRATIKQLRSQLNAQKNVVVGEVSSAYNNLITARERIRTYQEHVLFDSYDVARLARRSYEVGQSDITATLTAQQANVNVRLEYLNAIMDYQIAFTELEQAIGVPLQ
ncbi:MAG: TolC family protein, partial [Candidatus Obscuribacterales bacterium]|nr:TolC family protein [Candidatus Obscuribacterales bacterium]